MVEPQIRLNFQMKKLTYNNSNSKTKLDNFFYILHEAENFKGICKTSLAGF
jgi:hypothetical protein